VREGRWNGTRVKNVNCLLFYYSLILFSGQNTGAEGAQKTSFFT